MPSLDNLEEKTSTPQPIAIQRATLLFNQYHQYLPCQRQVRCMQHVFGTDKNNANLAYSDNEINFLTDLEVPCSLPTGAQIQEYLNDPDYRTIATVQFLQKYFDEKSQNEIETEMHAQLVLLQNELKKIRKFKELFEKNLSRIKFTDDKDYNDYLLIYLIHLPIDQARLKSAFSDFSSEQIKQTHVMLNDFPDDSIIDKYKPDLLIALSEAEQKVKTPANNNKNNNLETKTENNAAQNKLFTLLAGNLENQIKAYQTKSANRFTLFRKNRKVRYESRDISLKTILDEIASLKTSPAPQGHTKYSKLHSSVESAIKSIELAEKSRFPRCFSFLAVFTSSDLAKAYKTAFAHTNGGIILALS